MNRAESANQALSGAKWFFDSAQNVKSVMGTSGFLQGAQLSAYKMMWRALDDLRQEMADAAGGDPGHRLMVQVASGASVVVSAGFVTWLLRGGALAASLLSSMPVWSGFDPIPVLVARRKRREDGTPDDAPDQDAELALGTIFRSRSSVRLLPQQPV